MRTLHFNPRNFQEPFLLLKKKITNQNGLDSFQTEKRIQMFGSIMNRSLTYAQQQIDDQINTISVKIIYQNIIIKPQDRIIYNKNQYVITEIDRDYYNKNEIIFKAVFEKEYYNNSFNYVLNFKV